MIRELWHLPRPARNHYPGGFPLHFGGGALYGLRADIKAEANPDIICDAHNLPFKDNSFDFVLCDPPYSTDLSGKIYSTGPIKEKKYVAEAVRVCKVGGHIALYHWVMLSRPKGARYDRIIVIIGRIRHHARFCCVFQKAQTLFEWGKC